MDIRARAARLSVASNLALVVAKLATGTYTGSIGVLSEAIHSGLDLAAAGIALFAVRAAARPPDEKHRYGHGKIENLSAFVEALLIGVAACWIGYESIHRLATGGHPILATPGMAVMGASAVLNWFVSGHLMRVARATDSMALEADALHLRTDVHTSVGVFTGLLLVRLTGVTALDSFTALAVAAWIAKAAWDMGRDAAMVLIDARLPSPEEDELVAILRRHAGHFVEFHDLRSRRAGSEQHVDFHLVVHRNQPFEVVHDLQDRLEDAIRKRFPSAHVLIHAEPCGPVCPRCR